MVGVSRRFICGSSHGAFHFPAARQVESQEDMVLSTETSSSALPRFVTLTNARFVMGPMSTDKSGSRRAGSRALQTGISGLTTMNIAVRQIPSRSCRGVGADTRRQSGLGTCGTVRCVNTGSRRFSS
jgi:hypothetical protein